MLDRVSVSASVAESETLSDRATREMLKDLLAEPATEMDADSDEVCITLPVRLEVCDR